MKIRLTLITACIGLSGVTFAQEPPTATQFRQSIDGIGHMVLVPYYTAQPGNATLLNIINTDPIHGKAVKVRFRGASNADDVYNFTLFLAPGDVWAGEVSQNPTTGMARVASVDLSCTLPAQANGDFRTSRVNPAADLANETREGYVEILTMADVLPGTAVYTATRHVKGVPPAPCSQGATSPTALSALLTESGVNTAGLGGPTSGLQASWSVFNIAQASSWSGQAMAIVAVADNQVAGVGKMVMHPQDDGVPSDARENLTTDPLLLSGAIPMQHTDVPDLSTPYLIGSTPAQQAAALSGLLAKARVRNEYFTDERVDAQTDWVFSLPLLRYSAALNHATGLPMFTTLPTAYFDASNVKVRGDAATRKICAPVADYHFWDRSGWRATHEDMIPFPTPFDIRQYALCGAASVWSLNLGDAPSVLAANLTLLTFSSPFDDGWGEVLTPGLSEVGMPIIGFAAARATSTNVSSGVSGNFGITWEHSYQRAGNKTP